jgi:serine/threonine-protein kinase HipA
MSYTPVNVIEVRAWGRRVGAVALDPSTGWYAFAYSEGWLADGVELAPLFMPLREQPYQFPDLSPTTFLRLPPLLADSLPDAFGNALVNAWMAEHGVAPREITPLDRLAYAADRAMGALEFRPPARDAQTDPPTAIQLADLVLAARLTVQGKFSGTEASHAALQQLIQVGSSAGGARAKALVAFNPVTYQVQSAYAPLGPGFEQWLIKLDGVSARGLDKHSDRLGASAPYGPIEYAYSQMARAAEIEMMPCGLLAEGPRRHFMTQRFDRRGDNRIHMISLCALAHLDYNLVAVHSYDQYFQAVRALGLDLAELQQAYRRMVFNVMAVNHDDHTKNVAFLRSEDESWHLAPAFDLTHAYNPASRWTSRHLMGVNGKFEGITRNDLYAVGERNDVPGYRRVVREVQAAVEAWPDFAETAELDPETTKSVGDDLERFRPR